MCQMVVGSREVSLVQMAQQRYRACMAFSTASGMIPQVAFDDEILCDEGIGS